jgi:iron complex transport system ATP-binding protein
MERLVGEGYSLSLGVVNVGDSDYETAEGLAIECVEEAPFAPISDEALERAKELVKEAEAVIIAPLPFGRGNLKNLELAEMAQKEGKKILIAGNDISGRDFTGGEATKKIESLLQNGARLFSSIEELVKLLNE